MLSKAGTPLVDLEDWQLRAGPKSSAQWKPGRSALEVARAWLAAMPTGLPSEVQGALASHADFGAVIRWEGEPEVRLAFDGRGEPRNTDLLVIAQDSAGPLLIAVEAKADESFDRDYATVLVESLEVKIAKPASHALERAIDLAETLLPPHRTNQPTLSSLRYQLFTAAAGALCEAERRGIARAVLLVHEFVTDATTNAKHLVNASDLNAWTDRASGGAFTGISSGQVVGPITMRASDLLKGTSRLYVGKAVRNLRASGV